MTSRVRRGKEFPLLYPVHWKMLDVAREMFVVSVTHSAVIAKGEAGSQMREMTGNTEANSNSHEHCQDAPEMWQTGHYQIEELSYCLCLAMQLYLQLAGRQLPPSARMHASLLKALPNLVQERLSATKTLSVGLHPDLALWVLFVGATSASPSGSEQILQSRLVRCLGRLCATLAISSRGGLEVALYGSLREQRFSGSRCAAVFQALFPVESSSGAAVF